MSVTSTSILSTTITRQTFTITFGTIRTTTTTTSASASIPTTTSISGTLPGSSLGATSFLPQWAVLAIALCVIGFCLISSLCACRNCFKILCCCGPNPFRWFKKRKRDKKSDDREADIEAYLTKEAKALDLLTTQTLLLTQSLQKEALKNEVIDPLTLTSATAVPNTLFSSPTSFSSSSAMKPSELRMEPSILQTASSSAISKSKSHLKTPPSITNIKPTTVSNLKDPNLNISGSQKEKSKVYNPKASPSAIAPSLTPTIQPSSSSSPSSISHSVPKQKQLDGPSLAHSMKERTELITSIPTAPATPINKVNPKKLRKKRR